MSTRLFDALQVKPPVDWNDIEQPAPTLDGGEIILIDNVADYYFEFLPENWSLNDEPIPVPWSYEKSYPYVSPPFEEMWFEFETKKISFLKRVGVHVRGIEMTDSSAWEALPDDLLANMEAQHGPEVRQQCRWLLMLTPYSEGTNGVVRGPVGRYVLGVDSEGGLAKDSQGEFIFHLESRNPAPAMSMQPLLINPVLLAISFMHVKNASLLRQTPAVPTTRHAKRKARKNPPTSRYYVLQVQALSRSGAAGVAPSGSGSGGGSGGGGGGPMSLHIVRGHFATYVEGRGLFGKYPGKYHIPAHTRGDAEVGIVEKDYKIT